ncbi:MAG TPA: heterodisulfide reductase-related iron-sulfur binding cluster, partial [Pyrinomonadaceae bacterium]|nr:heterodisulfide reductase-related iron-sulfur binding cluster [Pyrinomonadaceae bacterium]
TDTALASALGREEDKLLACVHCGLCLEACPTYFHTGDENDSPRGRLYLMRAVEEERLQRDAPAFARHINRCLGCRACEQACPAGVQYGQLLEAARDDLKTHVQPRGLIGKALHFALRHVWLHPARLRTAFRGARFLRTLKIPAILRRSGLPRLLSPRFAFALALLEKSAPVDLSGGEEPKSDSLPANSAGTFRTALFTGCVMEGLFTRVNRATARVLRVNNCAVSVPAAQVCCGALHAHAGDLEGARTLARKNIEAFAADGEATIITNAGGCGAMIVSYDHLLADDPEYAERARQFSRRVKDVSQQLAATGVKTGAEIAVGATTYDASCHLLYGQQATNEPLRMLEAVSQLKLVPLAGSEVCCGGAGVYNLLEPELSGRVLREKLHHVKETKAQILATGNPGCHMQIAAGAADDPALRDLRVCHPIEILDESYRRANFYAGASRLKDEERTEDR